MLASAIVGLTFLTTPVLSPVSPPVLMQAAGKPVISLQISTIEPYGEETMLNSLREQIRLGVGGTRISTKWSDLETDAGYSAKPLEDQFGLAKFIGGDIQLTISPIDTTNKTVPPELMDLKFDDPKVVQRWEDLMVKVAKMIPPTVKSIALGNEIDAYLGDHPEQIDAYLSLVKAGRSILKGAGVKADVGVITTFDGLKDRSAIIKRVHAPFSLVLCTYYPLQGSFNILPIEDVPKHFDTMLGVAAGRPLVLTEIGCPASELNGSNEDKQAQFITATFAELKKHSNQIPSASYFMQVDFGSQVLDYLETYYRLKDDKFRGMLGSLGLRKANGEPRKSLAEFRKQMRIWNGE